jgi:hypothetical protein
LRASVRDTTRARRLSGASVDPTEARCAKWLRGAKHGSIIARRTGVRRAGRLASDGLSRSSATAVTDPRGPTETLVAIERARDQEFDLVIGADRLNSLVRLSRNGSDPLFGRRLTTFSLSAEQPAIPEPSLVVAAKAATKDRRCKDPSRGEVDPCSPPKVYQRKRTSVSFLGHGRWHVMGSPRDLARAPDRIDTADDRHHRCKSRGGYSGRTDCFLLRRMA